VDSLALRQGALQWGIRLALRERQGFSRVPSIRAGNNTSPLAGEVARQGRAGEGFHEPTPSGVDASALRQALRRRGDA
jgi:hypothetical protein